MDSQTSQSKRDVSSNLTEGLHVIFDTQCLLIATDDPSRYNEKLLKTERKYIRQMNNG